MNGQLFGKAVPQPTSATPTRSCSTRMLAAGLYSNWWLNPAA